MSVSTNILLLLTLTGEVFDENDKVPSVVTDNVGSIFKLRVTGVGDDGSFFAMLVFVGNVDVVSSTFEVSGNDCDVIFGVGADSSVGFCGAIFVVVGAASACVSKSVFMRTEFSVCDASDAVGSFCEAGDDAGVSFVV